MMHMTAVHVTAEVPPSWLGRLVRRIPGVRWLLRDRDSASRARAAAQLHLDHVGQAGHEISVHVTRTGDRAVAARIVVDGQIPY